MKLTPKWKTLNGVNAATVQLSGGSSPGRNDANQRGPSNRQQATAVKSSKNEHY